MSQLLEVRDLSVCYGEIRAVKSLSLTVGAKEIVSLIGSNGAGKTSSLRAISGLLGRQGGQVCFAGVDLSRQPPDARVRAGLAHVPEGRHVFAGLTVEENLQLGSYVRHDRQAVAQDEDSMYQLFPILQQRRRQKAGTLSGGEQQMLAIARAMMSRPRLLMLDEPTMGLSPKMIEVVLHAIEQIRQHTPILLVEQNTIEAIQMADYVYALRLGEVVARLRGDEVNEAGLQQLYLG